MTTTKKRLIFEHVACSRCGGSGEYSFNLMNGTRCFGCGGTGCKLTKRGRAALRHFDDQRRRPAASVAVGDKILFDMHSYRCYAPVESVHVQENGLLRIMATRAKTGESIGVICDPNLMVEAWLSAEAKAELIARSLEFQATLTKQGAPRKSTLAADAAAG